MLGVAMLIGVSGYAVPALAQKTYMVAVSGGPAIPVNRFSDSHGTGSTFTGSLAVGLETLPIGLRFDAMFNNFGGRNKGPGFGVFEGADGKITAGIANLIITFPGSRAKPYIITGGGLYGVKPDLPDENSKNHFGFNAGLGTTFGLSRFSAFIESRYHSISRSKADGGRLNFVPITFGLVF
ncbi:MAG TPA: hypothetical protein VNJ04_18980 [Gemmatimonadaceae bacterium]|nr:hypothetical protein [Gemmatimonadaceae bacterium]